MKKTIAALMLALTLSVTGCVTVEGGPSETSSTSAAPAPSVPSTPDTSATDQTYLTTLSDLLPELFSGDVDEARLIGAGKDICVFFDENGVSRETFVGFVDGFMSDGSFNQEQTTTIMAVAMKSYCPDTLDELLALDGGSVV